MHVGVWVDGSCRAAIQNQMNNQRIFKRNSKKKQSLSALRVGVHRVNASSEFERGVNTIYEFIEVDSQTKLLLES